VDDYFARPGTANGDDSGSATYRATNPVLGVTRHFGEALNVYANWGRGFESPTFTELAYRTGASGLNFDLQPSRSRHLEVGAKAMLGADHRLDAALFTIGTENEIAVDQNSGGRAVYRNAGRTERTGFELSYAGRWTETVTAYLALSMLDATFKDPFTPATGSTVATGNALPGIPDRMAFGEIAWRPRLQGVLAGLSTALEMVHSGRLYVNDANSDAASSYTVFNLRAGLAQRAGHWRVREFLRLDNITDRRYAGSVVVNDTSGRFFEPAPGRNWLAGVSLSYEFL
jgi:iron complex outermembrane receptor protein